MIAVLVIAVCVACVILVFAWCLAMAAANGDRGIR